MKFNRKGSHNITRSGDEVNMRHQNTSAAGATSSYYRAASNASRGDHVTSIETSTHQARQRQQQTQHSPMSDLCPHHAASMRERGIDCDGIVNVALDISDENATMHHGNEEMANKMYDGNDLKSVMCNHDDDYDDIDDNCVIKESEVTDSQDQGRLSSRGRGSSRMKSTSPTVLSSNGSMADESSSLSSYDTRPVTARASMGPVTGDSGVTRNGLRLVWSDVSFKLNTTSWQWDMSSAILPSRVAINKEILQKQSGQVTSGQMVGIIGPSGAGKSTLLNCLTGRYRYQHGLKGSVYVDCYTSALKSRKRIQVAFIPQKDNLFANFTVKETLIFASKIKNTNTADNSGMIHSSTTSVDSTGQSLSESSISKVNFTRDAIKNNTQRESPALTASVDTSFNHEEEALKVMKYLNLLSCANTRIKRCSGGQVKRVCIGVELISSPDLLVLDEPTTGLDSSTAYQCVSILKKLTQPMAIASMNNKSLGNSKHSVLANESTDVTSCTHHPVQMSNVTFSAPAILATIHQPSCKILNKFDLIYLISKNGQCLYFGPPSDIKSYFTQAGLSYPLDYNPADFAIETAYGDYGEEVFYKLSKLADESARNIISSYAMIEYRGKYTSNMNMNMNMNMRSGNNNNDITIDNNNVSMHDSKRNVALMTDEYASNHSKIKITTIVKSMESRRHSFISDIGLLLVRNWSKIFRDSGQLYLRIFQNIAIALMISFLWNPSIGQEDGCWNDFFEASVKSANASSAKASTLNKISSINSNTALLFALLIYIIMVSVMSTVLSFPSETLVVIKEMKNNWYSCTTYYFAKILAEVPILTLMILLLAGIIYPMTGQIAVWWRFGLVFLVASIMAEVCSSIGMLFGTIFSSDLISACFSSVASGFPPILFGGFVVPVNQIRWYLLPFAYTSYLKYAFESLLIAIYGFDRCVVKPAKGNVVEDIAKAKNPIELIGTLVSSFNLTSKDAKTFALLLNVDSSCVEGIINGTIDYFGINRETSGSSSLTSLTNSTGDDDYEESDDYPDAVSTTTLATPTYTIASQARGSSDTSQESASYVLSYFGLRDDMIYVNIAVLVLFMITLKMVTFYVLRRKTLK